MAFERSGGVLQDAGPVASSTARSFVQLMAASFSLAATAESTSGAVMVTWTGTIAPPSQSPDGDCATVMSEATNVYGPTGGFGVPSSSARLVA